MWKFQPPSWKDSPTRYATPRKIHKVELSVWAIVEGLVNAFGWTSVVIYVLLLLGGLYFLSTGSRKPA